MIKYSIGDIIRKERKAQSLSQEELCDGICTTSWLSKIESGACIPTHAIFEALMQRLGKSASQYVLYQSELEMKIERLKFQTRRFYATHLISEAHKTFDELKKLTREDNRQDQQFIRLHNILLYEDDISDAQTTLDLLYEAIHYTIPNYSTDSLQQYLLSKDELIIINNIAICYYKLEQTQKAISILKTLCRYLENPRFDDEEKKRTYPVVMYNLAKWQKLDDDFTGCLMTCETLLKFCVQYDTMAVLPELLYYKGCAFAALGSLAMAKQAFLESYYLFKTKKENSNAEHVVQSALELYQLNLNLD